MVRALLLPLLLAQIVGGDLDGVIRSAKRGSPYVFPNLGSATLVHWNASQVTATTIAADVGGTWTLTGPMIKGAGVGKYTSGLSGFSTSAWPQLGTGVDPGDTSGNLLVCLAFQITSSVGYHAMLWDNGDYNISGYYGQISGLVANTTVFVDSTAGSVTSVSPAPAPPMDGRGHVFCGWRDVALSSGTSLSLGARLDNYPLLGGFREATPSPGTAYPLVVGIYTAASSAPIPGTVYEFEIAAPASDGGNGAGFGGTTSPLSAAARLTIVTALKGFGQHEVACMGDSITYGNTSSGVQLTTPWPLKIQQDEGVAWSVANEGISGETMAQMLSRWSADVAFAPYDTVVVEGGTNDATAGVTASVAWANKLAVINGALANGQKVILLTVSPFANGSGWTVGAENIAVAMRASEAAFCSANPQVPCVNMVTLIGNGATPPAMNPTYDSGDGIHPNQTGANVIAAAVEALSP